MKLINKARESKISIYNFLNLILTKCFNLNAKFTLQLHTLFSQLCKCRRQFCSCESTLFLPVGFEQASNASQSSRGFPDLSIFWKTIKGSVFAPDERRVCMSFTQAKMIILVFESNRKNNRKRLPIFARRQWRNLGPMVLPCRYSSRFGSLGITSKISVARASKSLTLALDSKTAGSCAFARDAAASSFLNCSIRQSWKSRFHP